MILPLIWPTLWLCKYDTWKLVLSLFIWVYCKRTSINCSEFSPNDCVVHSIYLGMNTHWTCFDQIILPTPTYYICIMMKLTKTMLRMQILTSKSRTGAILMLLLRILATQYMQSVHHSSDYRQKFQHILGYVII